MLYAKIQQLGYKLDHAIKKVEGHPSIIISTNLEAIESLMLYAKIQLQGFSISGEDFKCFTIYGHGRHLVEWGRTIWINCQYPFDRRLYMSVFCVEVLRPCQPNGVMSSAVSLPTHTFTE